MVFEKYCMDCKRLKNIRKISEDNSSSFKNFQWFEESFMNIRKNCRKIVDDLRPLLKIYKKTIFQNKIFINKLLYLIIINSI